MKKNNGNWRYVSVEPWQIEKLCDNNSPEDIWIAQIDGEDKEEPSFDLHEILLKISGKEAKIVEMILLEGMTFKAVGEKMGVCKQAIHKTYKKALSKLALHIPESEPK